MPIVERGLVYLGWTKHASGGSGRSADFKSLIFFDKGLNATENAQLYDAMLTLSPVDVVETTTTTTTAAPVTNATTTNGTNVTVDADTGVVTVSMTITTTPYTGLKPLPPYNGLPIVQRFNVYLANITLANGANTSEYLKMNKDLCATIEVDGAAGLIQMAYDPK